MRHPEGQNLESAPLTARRFEEFLQTDRSIDVIHPSLMPHYELFFGPLKEGVKPFVTTETNIGAVLAELGLVESRSWAKKNGWWREADAGLVEVVFSKLKYKLWFLVKWRQGGEPPEIT